MASPSQEDIVTTDFINTDTETTCSVCYAEFLDAEDLKIHLEQMHKTSASFTLHPCPFCESAYPDIEAFCYHIRDEHMSRLKYCKYCTKVFNDLQKHKQHEKKHTNVAKSLLSCSQCPETFSDDADLHSHELEFHANNIDGIVFKDLHPYMSSILNMNFTTFMGNIGSDTPFTCIQCGFNSYDMDAYIKHLQIQDCRSFGCDTCGNIFKKRIALIKHHRANVCVSTLEDMYKKCKECRKNIKKDVYKEHMKNCKVYKCWLCDIIYNTMAELSEHQTMEHPLSVEIKNCKFCSRECVGTVALRKHLERTHINDFHLYKYMCKTCKEVFKHPQKLFAHYFLKHRDMLPYTCKICDKKFRIRKKFTLHIKLEHNSVGFVEFDENYHVYFVEKKSENPFIPTSLINEESIYADMPEIATLLQKTNKKTNLKSVKVNKNGKGKTLTVKNLRKQLKIDDESVDLTSEMPTETEGNITEVESKPNTRKRKKPKKDTVSKMAKKEETFDLDSSDDNEPLQTFKSKDSKKKSLSKTDKRFTCKVCNKYCYTYQNFHNHMSTHSENDKKTCIKCSREFKTTEKLEKHMKIEHSSSKLTEYLKNILQKRRIYSLDDSELTMSEKFQRTIKKVKLDYFSSSATVNLLENGQSAKKFLESFTPEDKNITINSTVSVKAVSTPFYRQPVIKMKKFEPVTYESPVKLAMPTKCHTDDVVKVNVKVRLVQGPAKSNFLFLPEPIVPEVEDNYDERDYESEHETRESIPEVADEVMIENEEPQKAIEEARPAPRKLIVDNIPKNYSDISIAHLLPEAPYFKIVKMNELLHPVEEKEKNVTETEQSEPKEIELPNGTKLVTVNPLAHLLDKPVEEVLNTKKNRYYKPKVKNFESLLKNALLNLENCPKNKNNRNKKNKATRGRKAAK